MSWDPEHALATWRALVDVSSERIHQHGRWGQQDLPDGTGDFEREGLREGAQNRCAKATAAGTLTYAHVLEEEVAEALAETDPVKLRAELIQVAAVAVQWVECLARRVVP